MSLRVEKHIRTVTVPGEIKNGGRKLFDSSFWPVQHGYLRYKKVSGRF